MSSAHLSCRVPSACKKVKKSTKIGQDQLRRFGCYDHSFIFIQLVMQLLYKVYCTRNQVLLYCLFQNIVSSTVQFCNKK